MDKRKTFFLLLMLSLVFAILSCSREESNPIDDGGGSYTEGAKLSLSPTTIKIDGNAGSRTISVNSNTKWSVGLNNSGDAVTGLSVSSKSGSGNGTITVKYDAVKTQYYQQSATIIVNYNTSSPKKYETVQIYRKYLP